MEKYEMEWVLEWCRKKLGKSKYCSVKNIKIRINNRMYNRGELKNDYSTIYVNLKQHSTRLETIETIIHEYVHAQQNMIEYHLINVFYNFKNYYQHPHEQEAKKTAKKLSRVCQKELVQALKSKSFSKVN